IWIENLCRAPVAFRGTHTKSTIIYGENRTDSSCRKLFFVQSGPGFQGRQGGHFPAGSACRYFAPSGLSPSSLHEILLKRRETESRTDGGAPCQYPWNRSRRLPQPGRNGQSVRDPGRKTHRILPENRRYERERVFGLREGNILDPRGSWDLRYLEGDKSVSPNMAT